MKINCQLSWTDYLDAMLLHRRPDRMGKIIDLGFWLLIAIMIIINLMALSSGNFNFGVWLLIFVLIIFTPFTRYVLYPYQAKHLFSQQKEFSAPIVYESTETNLISTTQFGTYDRPLSIFVNWKENEKLFVLYHTDRSFIMLPKRCFSDAAQVETFRSRLSKNITPSTGKMQRVVSIVFFGILIILMISFYVSLVH